jgi:LmbE family N-acetylglucosaminyl deacetylase
VTTSEEAQGPAALRERELRTSLAIVGVHEHRWPAYQDGELA